MKYKVLKRFVSVLNVVYDVGERDGEWDLDGDEYRNFLINEGYIEEIKEEKSVVFVPIKGQTYFYKNDYGGVSRTCNANGTTDRSRIAIGNCYETESDCNFAIEKAKVIRELEVLSNLKSNWGASYLKKWTMRYECVNGLLQFEANNFIIYPGVICFDSKSKIIKAVQQIGEDRILKYLFNVEK